MHEAWQRHGAILPPSLGPGIATRFAAAAQVGPARAEAAGAYRAGVRQRLGALLGADGYLLQPSATGAAPPIDL